MFKVNIVNFKIPQSGVRDSSLIILLVALFIQEYECRVPFQYRGLGAFLKRLAQFGLQKARFFCKQRHENKSEFLFLFIYRYLCI